jgi:ubiquinone biosynthesis protein
VFFQRLRRIGRAVEHVQRFRVIVGVFFKYGYGDLAQRLPLPAAIHLPFRKTRESQEEIAALTPPQRLRRAFEELGPAFVKLGQLLSTRSHLIPPEFIDELSKLHDEVPPVPFDQVLAVIASEFKRPPAECFASIEETPIGSASMAQVHRAVRLDGEKCAIKVLRPGIEKTVRADLEIMAQLAGLLERHVEGWQVHKPTDIVAEFSRRMEQEMDFRAEAAHVERFGEQFAGDPTIRVPKTFPDTSTRRVLTMERIDAIKSSNFEQLDAAGLDRIVIATRIADLVMKQIFVYGFFHADPHPGNIHILPGNVVCFLDFGMMGFLDQRTRETSASFVMGIAERNEVATASALLRLTHADLEPPRQGFEADVAEFMHRNFYRPLGEMMFGQLVNQLFELTARYRLTLPPDLSTMFKALALMENLVASLDPGHDILAQAKPFMQQARLKKLKPRQLLRYWLEFSADIGGLMRDLPLEVRRLMAIFKEGKGRIMVHHLGLENLINTLERIINRLAFSLVLSSLIIGSSIIVHAHVPPIWHDMSVIGVLGYLLAGIMGFWLLIAMLRHGKM